MEVSSSLDNLPTLTKSIPAVECKLSRSGTKFIDVNSNHHLLTDKQKKHRQWFLQDSEISRLEPGYNSMGDVGERSTQKTSEDNTANNVTTACPQEGHGDADDLLTPKKRKKRILMTKTDMIITEMEMHIRLGIISKEQGNWEIENLKRQSVMKTLKKHREMVSEIDNNSEMTPVQRRKLVKKLQRKHAHNVLQALREAEEKERQLAKKGGATTCWVEIIPQMGMVKMNQNGFDSCLKTDGIGEKRKSEVKDVVHTPHATKELQKPLKMKGVQTQCVYKKMKKLRNTAMLGKTDNPLGKQGTETLKETLKPEVTEENMKPTFPQEKQRPYDELKFAKQQETHVYKEMEDDRISAIFQDIDAHIKASFYPKSSIPEEKQGHREPLVNLKSLIYQENTTHKEPNVHLNSSIRPKTNAHTEPNVNRKSSKREQPICQKEPNVDQKSSKRQEPIAPKEPRYIVGLKSPIRHKTNAHRKPRYNVGLKSPNHKETIAHREPLHSFELKSPNRKETISHKEPRSSVDLKSPKSEETISHKEPIFNVHLKSPKRQESSAHIELRYSLVLESPKSQEIIAHKEPMICNVDLKSPKRQETNTHKKLRSCVDLKSPSPKSKEIVVHKEPNCGLKSLTRREMGKETNTHRESDIDLKSSKCRETLRHKEPNIYLKSAVHQDMHKHKTLETVRIGKPADAPHGDFSKETSKLTLIKEILIDDQKKSCPQRHQQIEVHYAGKGAQKTCHVMEDQEKMLRRRQEKKLDRQREARRIQRQMEKKMVQRYRERQMAQGDPPRLKDDYLPMIKTGLNAENTTPMRTDILDLSYNYIKRNTKEVETSKISESVCEKDVKHSTNSDYDHAEEKKVITESEKLPKERVQNADIPQKAVTNGSYFQNVNKCNNITTPINGHSERKKKTNKYTKALPENRTKVFARNHRYKTGKTNPREDAGKKPATSKKKKPFLDEISASGDVNVKANHREQPLNTKVLPKNRIQDFPQHRRFKTVITSLRDDVSNSKPTTSNKNITSLDDTSASGDGAVKASQGQQLLTPKRKKTNKKIKAEHVITEMERTINKIKLEMTEEEKKEENEKMLEKFRMSDIKKVQEDISWLLVQQSAKQMDGMNFILETSKVLEQQINRLKGN